MKVYMVEKIRSIIEEFRLSQSVVKGLFSNYEFYQQSKGSNTLFYTISDCGHKEKRLGYNKSIPEDYIFLLIIFIIFIFLIISILYLSFYVLYLSSDILILRYINLKIYLVSEDIFIF